MTTRTYDFDGVDGRIHVMTWAGEQDPRFVALLAHGYGEHAGRYEHVASALVGLGAVVYAPDHLGHGRSAGEPALVEDIEVLVSDLHSVADRARADHPASRWRSSATRWAASSPRGSPSATATSSSALVLSGPVIGDNPAFELLLGMDPIPEIPIDPSILSRDPASATAYAADPLVYHGPFPRRRCSPSPVGGHGRPGREPRRAPTLWIHGVNDQLVPYEVAAEAIDRIKGTSLRHTAYDGAAHEVFNETNSDEVLAEVAGFLTEVLALD